LEIITSHNALDFDGLAAMIAAGKIYPYATLVFSGTLSKNVKKFMGLYKDSLNIKYPKEIDFNQVSRMIIVDTANANRLGHLKPLADRKDIDFYVYDHHPKAPDDLEGSLKINDQVGAVTTILVEEIIKKKISISSFDATILTLGIYEDTGSLLFSSTTPRDVLAVAFLLNQGANLFIVANFMEQPFSGEQRNLLHRLLNNTTHYRIKNVDIVIAVLDIEEFIPGLDEVTHRLFEIENSDVVFSLVLMQGKVNVVGRSRTSNVKVNDIVRVLGGRGHEKAASAIVKNKNTGEVKQVILRELKDKSYPGLLAGDIMSTPVKTIPMDITMEEVGRLMLRYGHSGLPVTEGDKIVGVISRRDVDKAKIHELGHAPVKGFMTTTVIAVSPDTSLAEIQRLMVEHDIGRLPVIDNGKMTGIVSRTDILRTLHGDDYPEDHEVLYSFSNNGENNYSNLLQNRLPTKILYKLRLIGEIAETLGSRVYCVGGFVRDFFLQVPNYDIDLVVEGDGILLAKTIAERLGGREQVHEQFKTAVVVLPDGNKIDVATARTEYYEFPAALPRVEKSSLKEDLYRRDFTINTLALCLNPDIFGNLIDYFGGRKDLEQGYIRILYNLSFVEDPTRILRAIRFEQRYKFTIESDTLRFARDAVERRLLGKLSYKRIIHELVLILSEKNPVPSLKRIQEIGIWNYLFPQVKIEDLNWNIFKRIPIVVGWWEERYHRMNVKSWLVYLMVIFNKLIESDVDAIVDKYPVKKDVRKNIIESLKVPAVVEYFAANPDLLPSQINQIMHAWQAETVIYLLLCVKDEHLWEKIVRYLDLKDTVKVHINGNDLKQLGLKQGPLFGIIFHNLYNLKLNGAVNTREEEIATVKQWIEEGKFNNAVFS